MDAFGVLEAVAIPSSLGQATPATSNTATLSRSPTAIPSAIALEPPALSPDIIVIESSVDECASSQEDVTVSPVAAAIEPMPGADDVAPKESGRPKPVSSTCAPTQDAAIVFVPECVPDEALCISEGWCSICNGGDSQKDDLIVFCDRCGIPVHQSCYGIASVPSGDWFCHRCVELKDTTIPSNTMVCYLCQRYGGAMKPLRTLSPRGTQAWAHVLCVWWDPDVLIEDMGRMEPLSVVHEPLAERRQSPCVLCGRSEGWHIKCHWTHCNAYFHAICARIGEANRIQKHRTPVYSKLNGARGIGGLLQLDMDEVPRIAYHAYCDRHATCEFALDDLCDKLLASDLVHDAKALARLDALRTSHGDVDKFLQSTAKALVRVAEAGASTAGDAKEYQKSHLQAVQLVLDHLPQIHATYPSCSVHAHDLVPESLLEALSQTFLDGSPDPFLQCHTCEAAMHRTEKVWYCGNPRGPHANHWNCLRQRKAHASTKRKPEKRPKRAAKPKPPTPDDLSALIPTYDDGAVYCGMCDHNVDLRALVSVAKPGDATETTAAATVRTVVAPAKPDGPLIKARLGPPPSDRFRVERASTMCNHIIGLLPLLQAYDATPPDDDAAARQAIDDKFLALLSYLKPFDGYAYGRVDDVYTLFKTRGRGPGLAMLKNLVREYTRLMYTKHVRALEKAAAEKKAKELQDAAEFKRVGDDAAMKDHLLAMKKKEKARERNLKRRLETASKLANKKIA
ncbi:hypothetical protein SPRG_07933 [Saprolegnia parasitica CBS 223.65]|uniref:PHD-type domain-containing protein n=1 Tax=Saprolegnia parasitica (strain CBS 223.65) TaxID=695850 RepID=A0A067CIZ4_SAPPC|nr:hypothetical protein SPRG_07933 [Saprolegnia parasitica CBS 223.65]KDO26531.1 hypothetical protein SPRG_07933 [Saprolegnia parasitica CBS 223.65]|eukprot:XP_012202674.1 hypothetical protein SPRG_07933 [Saprolegnia parasitica CBS 223.65]